VLHTIGTSTAGNDTTGHEVCNHTWDHNPQYTLLDWANQVRRTDTALAKPYSYTDDMNYGAGIDTVRGFRAPFLHYDGNMFNVLGLLPNLYYDASIQVGSDLQKPYDQANVNWPYTLDGGAQGQGVIDIGQRPGLWELSAHDLVLPGAAEFISFADLLQSQGYLDGLPETMRDLKIYDSLGTQGLRLGALDYDLYYGDFFTSRAVVVTLCYNYHQRMNVGNCAPFTVVFHTQFFDKVFETHVLTPSGHILPSHVADRKKAFENFLKYVTNDPLARIVNAKELIQWMRNPVALQPQKTK
jgi:hypothetical protein